MDHWNNLTRQERQWVLIGLGVAAVFIVLIIIFVAIPGSPSGPNLINCNLDINRRPGDLPTNLLASGDYRSLVNISGYVEFIGKNANQFVPLNLKRVDYRGDITTDVSKLFLSFNCLMLEFTFNRDGISFYHIQEIYLNWSNNKSSDCPSTAMSHCRVERFGQFYEVNERFSCLGRLLIPCEADISLDSRYFSYLRPLARIVLSTLEFELDGNQFNIKENQFSKQASAKGCNLEE